MFPVLVSRLGNDNEHSLPSRPGPRPRARDLELRALGIRCRPPIARGPEPGARVLRFDIMSDLHTGRVAR